MKFVDQEIPKDLRKAIRQQLFTWEIVRHAVFFAASSSFNSSPCPACGRAGSTIRSRPSPSTLYQGPIHPTYPRYSLPLQGILSVYGFDPRTKGSLTCRQYCVLYMEPPFYFSSHESLT